MGDDVVAGTSAPAAPTKDGMTASVAHRERVAEQRAVYVRGGAPLSECQLRDDAHPMCSSQVVVVWRPITEAITRRRDGIALLRDELEGAAGVDLFPYNVAEATGPRPGLSRRLSESVGFGNIDRSKVWRAARMSTETKLATPVGTVAADVAQALVAATAEQASHEGASVAIFVCDQGRVERAFLRMDCARLLATEMRATRVTRPSGSGGAPT